MTPDATDPGRDSQLDAILLDYFNAQDAGQAPDQTILLARHPEYARQLTEFFAGMERVAPTLDPLRLAETPPAPGTRWVIGDYEILEEVGRGGMGVVYKARQLSLDRVVALKMILAGALASEADRLRFLREATTTARLQHPNVVQIHEVGEYEGRAFLALEYVDGPTLAERCGGAPQEARWSAEVVEAVARAVHHVHERGVVHRDLKPGNVMLACGETPKVMDFGLARQVEGAGLRTRTGAVVGTPQYMAPEQASGRAREAGPAADVWALGAILYQLLTGRPPFQAATDLDTLIKLVNEEPAGVRQSAPGCPRDLETICHKCLHKEPGKRYASAAALAEDLRRFLNREPIRARPVGMAERGWSWCRRNPVVAGLVSVVTLSMVVMVGLLVYAVIRDQFAVTESRLKQEALEAKQLNARYLFNAQLARVEAVYRREPGEALRLLNDVNACPIDQRDTAWRFYERACCRWELAVFEGHTVKVNAVAFSPDGLTLASVCGDQGRWDKQGDVRLWDVKTGQTSVVLKHGLGVTAVAFSPDGLTLATGSWDKTVQLWNTKTGQVRATLQGHTDGVTAVAFSPDGLTLASGAWEKTVRLWNVKTGQTGATLQGHASEVSAVAFSPDGKTLASGSDQGEVRLWDVEASQTRVVLQEHTLRIRALAFSPDGSTVASSSDDFTVRLWDVKTGQAGAVFRHQSPVYSVAFSPDGRTLASNSQDSDSQGKARQSRGKARQSRGEVQLWDVKTGQALASYKGRTEGVWSVAYSPDGRTLASGSISNRSGEVWLWDVKTGQGRPVLQVQTPGVWSVAFSPDGRTLAACSKDSDSSGEVRLLDVKTGQTQAVLESQAGGVWSVAFSPDGQTLVTGSGYGTVRLLDVKKSEARATLQGHSGRVYGVAFSPDGQRVFGTDLNETLAWGVKNGEPTDPANPPSIPKSTRAVSPDGSLMAEVRNHGIALIELAKYDPMGDYRERVALEETNRIPWHQQQAAEAERDENWFAAAFHLEQLLKLQPGAENLHRRDHARDRLSKADRSNAPRFMDKLPPP